MIFNHYFFLKCIFGCHEVVVKVHSIISCTFFFNAKSLQDRSNHGSPEILVICHRFLRKVVQWFHVTYSTIVNPVSLVIYKGKETIEGTSKEKVSWKRNKVNERREGNEFNEGKKIKKEWRTLMKKNLNRRKGRKILRKSTQSKKKLKE